MFHGVRPQDLRVESVHLVPWNEEPLTATGRLFSGRAAEFALPVAHGIGGEGLSITSITRDNGSGAVTLIFNSIPGHTYQIDSSPTLVPAISPQWLDVDDSFFATGNLSTFIDTTASGATLFYRIKDVTN